jgi:hypothetical protein
MPEHLHALPTIKDRRTVVSKCLEQSNQTGIELEYIPALTCAKQRTRLDDAESLPTEPFSQYKYDDMMASQHPLGGGKQRAHSVTTVNANVTTVNANIIEVIPDDRHCNACAISKSKMPGIHKGKTVRLKPVRKDLKLFVDLSGHIEEPSIWHNFH